MPDRYLPMSPDYWLRQVFSSKAARDGGIVRRSVRDVERILGRDAFAKEMQRRGFSVVENGGQFVIFCNHDEVRIVV